MRPIFLFLKIFTWFSLRNMRRYRIRTVIVLLGIALGAAVFSSVRLSIKATIDSFSQSMDRIAGHSDLVLTWPAGRLPEHFITGLTVHPDVAAATALMTAYVNPEADNAEPFLLVGLDPLLDRKFRPWQVRSAEKVANANWLSLIAEPATLFISDVLVRRHGWVVGDRITLEHSRQSAGVQSCGGSESRRDGIGRGRAPGYNRYCQFSGVCRAEWCCGSHRSGALLPMQKNCPVGSFSDG